MTEVHVFIGGALIVMAIVAAYQVGHKTGQAFAYRLSRHGVQLDRWYAEEPVIARHAAAMKARAHGTAWLDEQPEKL